MRVYEVPGTRYRFGGVVMFEYDTKDVLSSIGARAAFGQKGSFQSVGIRGVPDARVRPASDPFLAGRDLTRPLELFTISRPHLTRPEP